MPENYKKYINFKISNIIQYIDVICVLYRNSCFEKTRRKPDVQD